MLFMCNVIKCVPTLEKNLNVTNNTININND